MCSIHKFLDKGDESSCYSNNRYCLDDEQLFYFIFQYLLQDSGMSKAALIEMIM